MPLRLSTRNQLRATVKSVKLGSIMAEVIVALPDGQEIVSAITRASAESLQLAVGDDVVVLIKSTEVMLGKDE
jgi:molybdopterin-binding protein